MQLNMINNHLKCVRIKNNLQNNRMSDYRAISESRDRTWRDRYN